MDREVLLTLLALAVIGPALVVAAAWPRRLRQPASARQWERASWRAVWMPVVPAAIALSMLLGWAAMEPDDAEALPLSMVALSALFAAIWMRALIRAGKAARPRRSPIVAGTLGLWRPRAVLATDFIAQLDADQMHAVCAHEAAHVRHRDPLRIWLAQFATDLQWPWPSARQRFDLWRRVLELARDEEARQDGIDGADLASAVLLGAQWEAVVPGGAALIGSRARLEARIARLLAPLAADAPDRLIAPTLLVLAMCLLGAVAGARFGETLVQTAVLLLP